MAHRLLSVLYWCPQSCSCTWSSCWLREFIHVAVVYANEMPLFIGNIEFYIQSTINIFMFSVTLACMLVHSVSVAQFRCPSDWLCLVFFSYLYRWCQLALYLKSVTLARSSVEIFYLYQPGAGSLCLWSCFMIWKDTLFIHNYFEFTFMHIWAFLTFGLSLYV